LAELAGKAADDVLCMVSARHAEVYCESTRDLHRDIKEARADAEAKLLERKEKAIAKSRRSSVLPEPSDSAAATEKFDL
jgi:hypothetical protein